MTKRLTRPPAAHRDPPARNDDPDAMPSWTFRPIGVVRSPLRYVHDAPRQGGPGGAGRAVIELRRGMQNCLKDLAGFERAWIVFVFSYARGWREQVVPPRDVVKRGVLATRAPHRPNPVGITSARVVGVRGRTIAIEEHDLLDGTPVLDVKPYLPYCDAFPEARAGWVDALPAQGSDHRWK
jgi:tRNA-Thr(GGU) m(6)t(6)A37 methyltransferase TsaA